jgi:hypothetical protein
LLALRRGMAANIFKLFIECQAEWRTLAGGSGPGARIRADSGAAPRPSDSCGARVYGFRWREIRTGPAILEERLELMGISTSLVLIAVGAILKWAVTASTSGINLNTVGVVLMVVGIAGLVLSLIFWSSWGGFGSRTGATTVIRDDTTTLR